MLEQHSVFGRVTPQQKRAMVGALQSKGHVVAMTGDGVNDALALKDADIGVAMGSGAAATRAVAQLVLLDGKFATLPGVVAEGRRVIANIERSANLFVTKTVYAMLLAIAVVDRRLAVPVPAPAPHDRQHVHDRHPRLLPRLGAQHAALHPRVHRAGAAVHDPGRHRRGRGGARRATASRATATISRCVEARTTATLVLIAVGLWVLVIQARPFNWWKTLLVASMVGAVALIMVVPGVPRLLRGAAPAGRGARRSGDRGAGSRSCCSRWGGGSVAWSGTGATRTRSSTTTPPTRRLWLAASSSS